MQLQGVADVAEDAHALKKGVILEHDAHAPVGGVGAGNIGAVLEDRAGGGRQNTDQHPQQRGLAAAGRAQNGEELSVIDVEGDVLHHRDPLFISLGEVADFQFFGQLHQFSLSVSTSTVPAVLPFAGRCRRSYHSR